MTVLTGKQIADAGLDGWVHLPGGLHTRITTPSYPAGLALLTAIAAVAEERDHHPDLILRYAHLDVRLISHDVHGVTGRDVRLARAITTLAAEAGLRTGRDGVVRLELGLDTPDAAAVAPFWAAVFGAEQRSGEVQDPDDVLPPVWFQESTAEEPRQHWHPDVWLDPAEVPARLDAALAAGGTLVSDEEAPSFWVLADAQGNKVCLCTWQEPGSGRGA